MQNGLSLALIGFGEVGQIFARGWLDRGGVSLATYDLVFDDPRDGGLRSALAGQIGLRVGRDASDAARGAEIVISAVTADAAIDVAEQAAAYLKPGQIFFDINSAAPSTKRQAAAAVARAGAEYVEGAVMAPVPGPGLQVPILAGGMVAERVAALLNALGMNIEPVATEIGRASATKLCRSIMIKGIEALIIQSAAAARQWDVEADVFASLARTFPGTDWSKLAADMAARVRKHGIRRAAEMREAGAMLEAMDHDGALCRAVADLHEQTARAAKASA